MKELLYGLLRSLGIICLLAVGLFCVTLVYPLLKGRGRAYLNQRWSRCLLFLCGVQHIVRGAPVLQGPLLLVANHVSWIDIFVINTVRPTTFVSKSEVRHWPLVGRLVAGVGTLFIHRDKRHALRAVSQLMQQRFEHGEAVGLFPEGTTTLGFTLLPFYSSLFEPALQAGVTVQPLALRFLREGQRDAFAAFVGEETLVHNLWRLLRTPGLAVEAVYLPPVTLSYQDGKKQARAALVRAVHQAIQNALL